MTDNFVVIHGINSEDLAIGITSILKDYKDYKVQETPIIISAENYTVVQIKKNLAEFLAGNLPENVTQPNWDGTVEHAPVPEQPKPVVNNNQQVQPSQDNPNNIIKGKDEKGGEQKSGDQEFGPPPSPQGDKSGKKG